MWFGRNLAIRPEEDTTEVDGCPIRWLRWGTPGQLPTLVLVHGGGANARWWEPLAPFLAGQWCVVAPDLSGHGDSGWRTAYRTETWAAEVLAVAAAAGTDSSAGTVAAPPVLVGHSLGASVVGVATALAGDAVAATILCDIGVRARGEKSRSGRHFQNRRSYASRQDALDRFKLIPRQTCENLWYVRHIAEHSVRPVGPAGAEDPTRPPEDQIAGWAWKFDWRLFTRTYDRWFGDYLTDIGTPVACLHADGSRVVTAEVAQRLSDCLGPDTPVAWVPEARHHLMLDQPLAFVAGLRALLAVVTR